MINAALDRTTDCSCQRPCATVDSYGSKHRQVRATSYYGDTDDNRSANYEAGPLTFTEMPSGIGVVDGIVFAVEVRLLVKERVS